MQANMHFVVIKSHQYHHKQEKVEAALVNSVHNVDKHMDSISSSTSWPLYQYYFHTGKNKD